jgi:hypothetical protein
VIPEIRVKKIRFQKKKPKSGSKITQSFSFISKKKPVINRNGREGVLIKKKKVVHIIIINKSCCSIHGRDLGRVGVVGELARQVPVI